MADFTDVPLLVRDPDGSTRKVATITSNRDHVGNLIAEGDLPETGRLDAIIRLYDGQLQQKQRELVECQKLLAGRG